MTSPIPSRRLVFTGLAAAAAGAAFAEPPSDITLAQDFDELWETLRDRYCFFGEKATDWSRVRALHRPRALAVADLDGFRMVLGQALRELYDTHTQVADAPQGFPRFPPFDLVVEPGQGGAAITAVRPSSAAAKAGVGVGDRVTAVEGRPIAEVAAELAPRCLRRPDPAAALYALNAAVAGRRGQPRRLTLAAADGGSRVVDLPLGTADQEPDLSWRRLETGVGLIRIASFASMDTIDAFDRALAEMAQAPGLILDVRRNGGGDTAVARPIMGRFIKTTASYARMRRRQGRGLGPAWTEYVEPRGPFTYERPVVVLTDEWSASMAEGFPMGMRGLGRARIVGRPMMRLGAAVFGLKLDRTGVEAQYSAEPVYDVAGNPRWTMRPDVETTPGADILAAGEAEIARLIAG